MATPQSLSFAALLKHYRRSAGLTQEQLAARAGYSVNYLSLLERGGRRPVTATLELLAQALGLDQADRSRLLSAARPADLRLTLPPSAPPTTLLVGRLREVAEDDLPVGTARREPGEFPLEDRHRVEPLYQLVPPDLPPPKTLERRAPNLPLQPTPLLGRKQEVEAVCALLRDHVRLVTITGPGGVGKTRLGLQVAVELSDAFADGVWFVPLSQLRDPDLVLSGIAQTLGLQEMASRSIQAVLQEYLPSKHLLLLLDNFEQVAEAAPQVARLLQTSPKLKVLVTSRAVLHLRGEHEYPLAPLALPPARSDSRRHPSLEQVIDSPAVALFIQRAHDARSDFQVTSATAPVVAAICARLDGLPLAIELAARRVKLPPPAVLLERLEQQLPVLTGGPRDLEERQRTMRNTLAWSYGLLAADEQRLVRRLAVFVGGWTLEAAEAVCTAAGVEPLGLDVLDGLSTLVDQSLVQQRAEGTEGEEGGGEPRFGMLQVIREYALERLEASDGGGEAEALRQAQAAYYLALAERAEPELVGQEAGAWLDRLEREHANLRAALSWAQELGEAETGLRLVAALWRFWRVRGHFREGRAWVQEMLAVGSGAEAGQVDATMRARALLGGGTLAIRQGDYAMAETQLEQARALAQAAGDTRTTRRALTNLGLAASTQGDLERAAAYYTESLALARQVGDQRGIALVLTNLGTVARRRGDLERAAAYYAESLALARQVGDQDLIAVCFNNLGVVALKRGDIAQGEALGREALASFQELGNPRRCAAGLETLAEAAVAAGQGERAARLLGAAAALRETLGVPLPPPERDNVEQAVATTRATLGESPWAAAFAAGQALSLEEAIAEALGEASG